METANVGRKMAMECQLRAAEDKTSTMAQRMSGMRQTTHDM
jgi:hypothetical protein